MRLLVDGDIICYRVGFAGEKNGEPDPISHVLHSVKLTMQKIELLAETVLEDWDSPEVLVFFSCPTADNWRTTLYPEYKANRRDRKPVAAQDIRDYLSDRYEVRRSDHHEADDLISMLAWSLHYAGEECIIASIDKDFKQIPCHFLNWVKEEIETVSSESAARFLAQQRVMGDTVDNIKGVPKYGAATTLRHFASTHRSTYDAVVRDAYELYYKDKNTAAYHDALNTALVTLPQDPFHVIQLQEAVTIAKSRLEESKDD